MEERRLNYLLDLADITLEEVDRHINEIDKCMARVHRGTEMVDCGAWDNFPVTVTKIIDRSRGIVQVYEESIYDCREMSILNLEFLEDYEKRYK